MVKSLNINALEKELSNIIIVLIDKCYNLLREEIMMMEIRNQLILINHV